jgi:hypothetical protein
MSSPFSHCLLFSPMEMYLNILLLVYLLVYSKYDFSTTKNGTMEITRLIYFGKKYLHWMVLTTFGYMTYTFPCSCCGVLDLLIKLSCKNLLRYWWNTLMKCIAPILKVNSIVSLWFGYSLPTFYRCKFHQLGVHLFCFSHCLAPHIRRYGITKRKDWPASSFVACTYIRMHLTSCIPVTSQL